MFHFQLNWTSLLCGIRCVFKLVLHISPRCVYCREMDLKDILMRIPIGVCATESRREQKRLDLRLDWKYVSRPNSPAGELNSCTMQINLSARE